MIALRIQKFKKVMKEVWPKLLIFTIMIAIVVFQKAPEKLKAMGFSDDQIKEQYETGEFKSSQFEEGPFQDESIRNIKLTAILLAIFLIIRWINNRQERQDEEEMEKQKIITIEEKEEEVDDGVDTYKNHKLRKEATEKKKQVQNKEKKKKE